MLPLNRRITERVGSLISLRQQRCCRHGHPFLELPLVTRDGEVVVLLHVIVARHGKVAQRPLRFI